MKYQLDTEEKEILNAFEWNELKSVPNVVQEIEASRQAARNTFNKTKRVNLRLTECDFHMAHIKALEEALPYQTWLSSVIHKYLTGRLVEKT
jgi:predicted DNA binding CopG/RHH family protein